MSLILTGKRVVKLRPAMRWAGVGVLLAAALAYEPAYSQSGGLTLPYSGTVSSSSTAFTVNNTGTGGAITGNAGSGKGVLGTSSTNFGVQGSNNSSSGVVGYANTTGAGVFGQNNATSGTTYGVYGTASSSSGYGVYGVNTATLGTSVGIYGNAIGSQGYGIYGINSSNAGSGVGIYGTAGVYGVGVHGEGGGVGIEGLSTNSNGVVGVSANGGNGSNGIGMIASGGTGLIANGQASGVGIIASVDNYTQTGVGKAAHFSGDVDITGTLTLAKPINAPTKSFKIDHPLDPANKYLVHSCIESNEMANTYSGNIVLDQYGKATVDLPSYCQALNKDFRYQLTCIGKPAPVYIAEEVDHNRFMVAGGTPGLKVSWQVTGTRHDAYATAHPLVVELAKKGEERGTYMFPVEAGKSRTLGLYYQFEQAHKLSKMSTLSKIPVLRPLKMPTPLPMPKPDFPAVAMNAKP